jgi:excisionase family DNA binding protein
VANKDERNHAMKGSAMSQDPLLTVDDVAKELAVHPDTVRKWIRNRELEAINLGGPAGYRIRRSALDRFIRERLTTSEDGS